MPGPFPQSKKIPDSTDDIPFPKGIPPKIKPYFLETVEQLKQLKLSNRNYQSIVYSLSVQLYRRQELVKDLIKHGESFEKDGMIRINPSAKQLNDVVASIMRLSNQLGLDPRSLKAITGDQNPEEEPEDINDVLDRMTG